MPNYYTNLLICSPGYDFDCERFNAQHAKTNLCELVAPMPADLADSVQHLPSGKSNFFRGGELLGEAEVAAIASRHGTADWHDWQVENWGIKWGTERVHATVGRGDTEPVFVEFVTPWKAPLAQIKELICRWLCQQHQFRRIAWVGYDPFDGSTRMLYQHEAHEGGRKCQST